MKALVLAGGFPQIDLIEKLKKRNITTVLADYNANSAAWAFADKFYQVSTLDVDAIRNLAKIEEIDFLITVCTDQALLTVAQVSEELGLPCYLDYETACKVTNKSHMKSVLSKHGIPTAEYEVISQLDSRITSSWDYPLIMKPVDCNSSKGVRKVSNELELEKAFCIAYQFSRSKTVLVEKFIEGKELSVDVYVENGKAMVLDITMSEKIQDKEKFVIFRTWHPAGITGKVEEQVGKEAQRIASAFQIKNSPMLIQMVVADNRIYVIEFSARTGGGVKHLSIERNAGIDMASAVIDLTLGIKPHIRPCKKKWKYMLDEYIYCNPGCYDHAEGFEWLKKSAILLDYYIFCRKGARFDSIEKSGDRAAGFTIVADSVSELIEKHNRINTSVRIVSADGKDIMRHELSANFDVANMLETTKSEKIYASQPAAEHLTGGLWKTNGSK